MVAMSATRLFQCAVASAFILLAGCSFLQNPLGAFAPRPPAPAKAPPVAVTTSTDTDTADALAARVASYTRDMQRQMDHPATQPAEPEHQEIAAAPQPAPGAYWLGADPFRLTPYEQEQDHPILRHSHAIVPVAPPPPSATGDANFPAAVPEGTGDSSTAGQAINASATQSPGLSAERLEETLAQKIRDDPQDLESQLNYELMLFIEGEPVPSMSALAGLRDEDREVLSAIMDGLSNFRSVIRSGQNLLLASKTGPLIAMADRLRTQSELALPTVALCSMVKTYGVYTPMDSSRFIAGRENQVVVYCEVQNFQSLLTHDNQWQTQLTEQIVLYTESGLAVWPERSQPQPVVDLCRQKRHDFFIARLVTLPANLSVGRYLLKLTVTDQEAHRVAESSTPIALVAE
jgi:hypothetical protein